MFKHMRRAARIPVAVFKRLEAVDCAGAAAAFLRAFGAAAATSIYCLPYYPLADDLAADEDEAADEHGRKGEGPAARLRLVSSNSGLSKIS